MYEAVRQRASSSTQLAGLATTAMVLSAASYLVLTGLGQRIVAAVIPPTILVDLAEPTPPEPSPEPEFKRDTDVTLPVPDPLPPPDDIVFKHDTPVTPPQQTPETGAEAAIAPAPAPTRIWPKMLSKEKPPYPPGPIRLRQEGDTRLLLCVDARGRVTSAELGQSSGSSPLDQAALKWIRGVRFSPGTVGGAPQPMCGHKVTYEWRLEDAR
jgi:protein TonB